MLAVEHSFGQNVHRMSEHPPHNPKGAKDAGSDADSKLTLDRLGTHLQEYLEKNKAPQNKRQLQELFDMLYAASLLKEEGAAVRVRIIFAPPEEFTDESLRDVHALRFENPHELSASEIKRLSPAANFYHSLIVVWPDDNGHFRIWGILNTGLRWMNSISGGRKPAVRRMAHPIVHVRDPGWLLFYENYELLGEWRGLELHGPQLDVFESSYIRDRFIGLRQRVVKNIGFEHLPNTLSIEIYADLIHRLALQLLRRIISLIRNRAHGGSLIILTHSDPEEMQDSLRWINCKYAIKDNKYSFRVRLLLKGILRRIGEMSPAGASVDDAWKHFQSTPDAELDDLEEAFFELAHLYADMMQVDGALVLEENFGALGFGGEIITDRNVVRVEQALDLERKWVRAWNVLSDGTRHRSMYRLCAMNPEIMGYVVSQDGQVRMIANVEGTVTFWQHSAV
ncbi:MAG: putative sensor domain DACNV-containing protein [Chthoniobacterales bacterium]